VALLGTIGTALTFAGINPFWEKAVQGAIILAALISDTALGRFEKMADSIPIASTFVKSEAPWRSRLFPNNEWVLLLVLLAEIGLFSFTGTNFLTRANAFEITRLAVEVGLIALR
jgi:ribose/xylose/arabinose/galactoside ABC-type transport system permease subunit